MKKLVSLTLVLVLLWVLSNLMPANAAGNIGSEPPDFELDTNEPTFVVTAGANTVTGVIGPTPNDQQDRFSVTIPVNFEVTSVSFNGPTGGSFVYSLSGCGISGSPNLNQTFNPPETECQLDYIIGTDFSPGPRSWAVTINVTSLLDPTPPVWTVPSTITVNTDPGQATAVVDYTANVTDNVGVVSASCLPAPNSVFAVGTTTVNCTAEDAVGNEGTASFDVVVNDNEAPVITLNGDATVDVVAGNNYVDAGATAIDNVDGDISNQIVVGGASIDATTPAGMYEITYSVTDAAGNAAVQVVRTVIVFPSLPNDVNDDRIVSPADAAYVINRVGGGDLSADVNGDDTVDQTDVDAVIAALGTTLADVFPVAASDVNRDGIVSAADVVYVINRLGGSDLSADVNGDSVVNQTDVNTVIAALGMSIFQ